MHCLLQWLKLQKASETLETLENLGLLTSDVLYDNILVLSALFNFFLLIITGLVFVLTLSSGFPPVFSNIMTVSISVEFIYLLFVYGKLIPGYKGLIAERSTNTAKETIKID